MGDEEKTWEWEQSGAGELTEQKREQYYWRFSLVFLVLAPLTFLGILQDELNFSLEGYIFVISAITGFPIALVWEIILGRIAGFGSTQKFFIKHPTVACSFNVKVDPGSLPRIIIQRLQADNFNFKLINPQANEKHLALIQFKKQKIGSITKFLDHAFNGDITIFQGNQGAVLHIRLTMEDTIIMDTGETKKLNDLCSYLATGSREFAIITLPLLVNVMLGLCTTGIILGIIGVLVPSMNMGWVFVFSLIGALSGLVSCVKILLQPKALIGIRLSIIGIILGLIPIFAIITRIILKGIM